MVPAHLRVVACAGLVAASLTGVGPTIAAASADPGGSGQAHSRSEKDSGRDHDGDRRGKDRDSSAHDSGKDQRHRGDDRRANRDGRDGPDRGGKSHTGGPKEGDDTSDTGDVGYTEDVQVASRSVSSAAPSDSLVAEPPPQAASVEGSASVVGGGGSGGAIPPAFVTPTATVGNSRTPGFVGGAAQSSVAAGSVPASVAPVPPVVLQSSPDPAVMPSTPILREFDSQGPEFIDRMWAPLRPAFPGGLVFGITGLLIAPLAGVWLGYRQARAADAADRLVNR